MADSAHSSPRGEGLGRKQAAVSPGTTTKSEPPAYRQLDDYKGFIFAFVARAPWLIFALTFLGPALIVLAEEDVGDNGTVLGFIRASNLVAALYIVFVIANIFVSPIVGTIADVTPHRKRLIAGSYAATCSGVALCVILTPHTYIAVAFLLLVTLIVGEISAVPVNSYLPEMTDDASEMSAIAARGGVAYTVTSIGYALMALALTEPWRPPLTTSEKVRIAAVTAAVMGAPAALYSVAKLTPRKAARALPPGAKLLTYGIQESVSLFKRVYNKYRQLGTMLVARAFYFGVQRSIVALASTYLVTELDMSSGAVSSVLVLALLLSIPGAIGAARLAQRLPQKTVVLGLLYTMFLSFIVVPFVLYRPAHAPRAFAFGALWGVVTGGLAVVDKSLFSALIPGGMEAKLFGLYASTNSVLEWLPPLVFIAFNEAVGRLRWAMTLLNLFYIIGIATLHTVDVGVGKAQVQATMHLRRHSAPDHHPEGATPAGAGLYAAANRGGAAGGADGAALAALEIEEGKGDGKAEEDMARTE